MLSSISTTLRTGTRLPFLKGPRRLYLGILLAIALVAGATAYYRLVYVPAHTVATAAMQTASARQGEITLAATGTGTLTAPEQELGFSDSGEMTVTAVYVKAGDLVSKGDVLAEVDSTQATSDYQQAKQQYDELTSTTAVAAAARAVADAQSSLQSARLQLEYLISPAVVYWETECDKNQAALRKAETELSASPDDAAAQKAVKKAKALVDFDQDQIAQAWQDYKDDYVPATFPLADNNGSDDYVLPTEMEITKARLAIGTAKTKLTESQELYAVLTGDPMPADTNNESLIAIKKASSNLDAAQAKLDGTKITAPFDGTVMQVNASGGDTAAFNSTDSDVVNAASVILLDDTSHPYLEVFWNESDWSMLKVGTAVEITFDDLPDKVFTGKITEVDSDLYTGGSSTAVRGEVSLDSSYADLNLPVGASASVQAVSKRSENAIYIPLEALHDLGSGQYAVFVLTNGEPKVRMVQVGIQTETYAEITSGLEAGDVVTTGLTKTK